MKFPYQFVTGQIAYFADMQPNRLLNEADKKFLNGARITHYCIYIILSKDKAINTSQIEMSFIVTAYFIRKKGYKRKIG